MIRENLYPYSSTPTDTDMQLTAGINSLNLTDKMVDPLAAYYMGKLKTNYMYYTGSLKVEGSGSSRVFSINVDKHGENNWAYMYTESGAYSNPAWPVWGGSQWQTIGSTLKFINSMKWYKANIPMSKPVGIKFALYDFSNEQILGTGERIRYSTTRYETDVDVTFSELYDYLHNGSLSVTINSTPYTLTQATYSDYYWDVGDNKRIYVEYITKPSNYNCTYYNGHNFYLDLVLACDSPSRWQSSYGIKAFRSLLVYPPFDIELDGMRPKIISDIGPIVDHADTDQSTWLGTKPFEVTYACLNFAADFDHRNWYILNSNDDLMYRTSDLRCAVNHYCDFGTWLKMIASATPKWSTNKKADGTALTANDNAAEYYPNSGVPIFDKNNTPTTVVKSDTYDALKPQLKNWQRYGYDIVDDDYDPEGGGGGGGDDDWDPDTATGEDTNDYEQNPETTLNKPPFGGYGPRFWVMSNSEFQAIYDSIMQIYKAYANYFRVNSLDPAMALAFSWLSAQEAIQQQYSGFAGGNPLDAVAAVFWYPFDVSMVLRTRNANFRWGLTDQTDWVSGDGTDGTPPVVAVQQKLEATDFAENAYWLDGGFTDYFKHYGNFMDYSPYCRAELYLPYCGSIQIDPNMFVGHHISVRYLIDFNSGACLALVYRDDLVVDSVAGQIGIQLPISSPNYGTYISQAVSATSGVNNARIGLIGSAVSALTAAGQTAGAVKTELGVSGAAGGLKALGHSTPTLVGAGLDVARSVNDLAQASYALEATKPAMQVCSTATPIISAANEQVCRLVLYQPRWLDGYSKDNYGDYGHTTGFATIENKTLTNFTGLTIAESVDTSGIGQATEKEKAMIAKAFKTGVYMPNS